MRLTLVGGRVVEVDGYCAETNTVYEFDGCFYHGCPCCYQSDSICPHRVKKFTNQNGEIKSKPLRFGNLLSSTIVKHEQIKESGFELVTIWECQWDKKVKEEHLPHSRADIEHLKPLIPRDAYFGGRTNAVKLYYLSLIHI